MKIEGFLKKDRLTRLPIREPLLVAKGSLVKEVIPQMKAKKVGCALVQEKDQLIGIFTERDILQKIVPDPSSLSRPVGEFMSSSLKVLKVNQTVGRVIKLMSEGGYRNLPVVNAGGGILGYINVKDVVRYLASFFPCEVFNLPPNPHQISKAAEGA